MVSFPANGSIDLAYVPFHNSITGFFVDPLNNNDGEPLSPGQPGRKIKALFPGPPRAGQGRALRRHVPPFGAACLLT